MLHSMRHHHDLQSSRITTGTDIATSLNGIVDLNWEVIVMRLRRFGRGDERRRSIIII